MIFCIECENEISGEDTRVDECEDILVRYYSCENCGLEFKRAFKRFREEKIN